MFLIFTLYIPNFTLISDLASDLGVASGPISSYEICSHIHRNFVISWSIIEIGKKLNINTYNLEQMYNLLKFKGELLGIYEKNEELEKILH